jgi:hypothetical protein
VDVLFDSDVKFLIQGKLQAIGTPGNSIRFMKGIAPEWGGLRFTGTDSSTLVYVKISDGRANGTAVGDSSGGAIYAVGSGLNTYPRLLLQKCVIAGNSAIANGGGIFVHNFARATLQYCTVTANTSSALSGAVQNLLGGVYLTGCILWGNSPYSAYVGMGTFSYGYCDLQGGQPVGGTGTSVGGNINADPLFVNAAGGDYRITVNSPCKDAGAPTPTSPLDPDGTTADMGAFFYDTRPPASLSLPSVVVRRGNVYTLPVAANTVGAYNVDLSFTIDTAVIAPHGVFIASSAFDGIPGATREWLVVGGNTVRIVFISSTPVVLTNGVLVNLTFAVKPNAPMGASPLTWDTGFTNVNDVPATCSGGTVTVVLPYGDVTGDGNITAGDASAILQYVVGITQSIPVELADVTDNGKITGFDAAWILIRVLDPQRLFPVEGGERLPGTKPATGGAVALRWERTGSGWMLAANDATGIIAGDMVLTLPDDAPVTVSENGLTAYRQDGRTLYVSFVRSAEDGNALLSLITASGSAPQVADISFNEDGIRESLHLLATPFALSQNLPNPFNPSTTIRFNLPENAVVRLTVYDATGALVRTLVDGRVNAGSHEVTWNGADANGRAVASGVYFYRLADGRSVVTRRMTLLR